MKTQCTSYTRLQPITELTLTPMIDILFILLIFFLASYKTYGFRGYSIEVPQEEYAQDLALTVEETLIITIDREGRLWFKGKQTTPETLTEQLTHDAHKNPKILISADSNVQIDAFVHVLDTIQKAGITSPPILHTQKKQ